MNNCDHKDRNKTSRYVKGELVITCKDCEEPPKEKIYIIKKGSGWSN